MTLGIYWQTKSKAANLRQTPSVLLALFLCVSSLHFLDLHADGCLPTAVEEPAAHDHGHEDPGEDHHFLIKKQSSDDFLSDRKFHSGQILCLPSFTLPPQLPPPKN
ncbi:MAG: hypothetical protein WBM17_05735 [Anaerolineales bacterium]